MARAQLDICMSLCIALLVASAVHNPGALFELWRKVEEAERW